MTLRRLSRSGLALLLLPLVVACEPADQGPPPMMPENQFPPPPPPPAPAASDGTGANGMYASGEYTIGEDSDTYDDNDPSALTDFRQTLDPHGTWVEDPTYGTVWTPSPAEVGTDFTPYTTAGHWTYDSDYVWVSDYDWGWAPFHYGRWVFIDGRGWAWIPGREYRGAWVGWGVDDGYGYVGWYPLAPPFLWFGGVAVGYSFAIGPRWGYCPHGELFSPGLSSRMVTGPAVATIAGRVHAMPSVGGVASRGPEPSKLGFTAAQIPHPTGAAATGLARAQQFARPSTATALGAHPAVHGTGSISTQGRTSLMGGASGMSPGAHAPTSTALPQQQPQQKKKLPPQNAAPPRGHTGGHGGGHHR